MGNVKNYYKEILKTYIKFSRLGIDKKYEPIVNDEKINSLTVEELENLVLCFNKNYRDFAIFEMGIAVSSKMTDWLNENIEDYIDISIEVLKNVMNSLGIVEPKEVDFFKKER